MSAHAVSELVTAAELIRMPRGRIRRELVLGQVAEFPLRGEAEGAMLADLSLSLLEHVRSHDLGEVFGPGIGFQLSSNPDTVLAPAVSFVHRERFAGRAAAEEYFAGAPDLAVEVASPATPLAWRVARAGDWLTAGCRMVVLVSLDDHTATVYRPHGEAVVLTEADELDGADVVPGWRLPVRELFV